MKKSNAARKQMYVRMSWLRILLPALFIAICLITPLFFHTPHTRNFNATVLHFHGNPSDDAGSTGSGDGDVAGTTTLPALKPTAALGTGAPGHWDVPNPALDGTGDRNIYDPNWVWTLSGPTIIGGPMEIRWWASCGACGSATGNADWNIRIWADGNLKFLQRVRVTPSLPNVAQLLTITVFVKENQPADTSNPITASSKIVLQIDPVFIDTQQNTHIYYDSQSACTNAAPGTTDACDSQVTMPVLAPGEPLPTPNQNTGRTANYISGGMTFSPNVTVKAPVAAADGEPSSRTDTEGNFYISGIRGFPAGIDLWYDDLRPIVGGNPNPSYDPYMRNWTYKGQPDAFNPCSGGTPPPECSDTELGGDGGGDVDLAVSRPDPVSGTKNNPPTLSYTSLIAANMSTGNSTDRANTYNRNPLGNVTGGVPGDDRQWEEFLGQNVVYLFYRTLAPAVSQIQRSTDGGFTFGPAQTASTIGQAGYIDVHQATGTVYISGSSGQVCHSTTTLPTGEAAVYDCHLAASDGNGVAHLFFVVKVADDGTANGTVYVAYSNDHDIFLLHSTDSGVTWSQPVRVSNGPETATSVFPWLETGPTPGSVGVVWYGTTQASNNDNADWNVFYAQSFDATANMPTFRQAQVSDHFIHGSNISEGGLLGNANRNLLDYFQVTFDPHVAAVVGWTDDHNDFTGHTYIAHQISGPNIINGSALPDPGPAPAPDPAGPYPHATDVCNTALTRCGLPGSQVTDFPRDVRLGGNPETGGLFALAVDDPVDVLSIKYSTEPTSAVDNSPVLVAAMRVSGSLSPTPPPDSYWRMNFTANAPNSTLSPTGDYSFGLSDRGDQFYVKAVTDPSSGSIQSFLYGKAVRTSSGAITYTDLGAADCGFFDTANNLITVKVALSKLNAALTAGHTALGVGTVLTGLRGSTFTSSCGAGNCSGNNKQDITRGGTQYTTALGALTPCTAAPTAAPAIISGQVLTSDGTPLGGVVISLNGLQSLEAITDNQGYYSFADVAAGGFYVVTPSMANYQFSPSSRSFSVTNNVNALFTAEAIAEMANPLDTPEYFVREHYLDFLGREPDQGGFNYWSAKIKACGNDADCIRRERINVSAAFFMEREFQETGSFVYRLYKGSLGRRPNFAEFSADRSRVIGGNTLEESKVALVRDFVQRADFKAQYPENLSNEQFVQKSFDTAGIMDEQERADYITALNNGASRIYVLSHAIEDASFKQREYNPTFVLMEYFSYLRRDPTEGGYQFWLDVLNNREPGNYRGMVCSFITSSEYQRRFSSVVTRSNAECGQ